MKISIDDYSTIADGKKKRLVQAISTGDQIKAVVADESRRAPKIYLNYLGSLLNWWLSRPSPPLNEVGVLHVIGESHSLTTQETRVETNSGPSATGV